MVSCCVCDCTTTHKKNPGNYSFHRLEMGRPCTKCPSTTVQSCCGLRNLRVASLLIGFLKALFFLSAIIGLISILSGNSTGNKDTDENVAKLSTGHLLLGLFMAIGFLFLAVVLITGIFKKRRNYVMIYWVVNLVWIVLSIVGLFTANQSVLQGILVFVYTVADIYFQIVIRSYYLEMTGAAAPSAQNENAAPVVNSGTRY